MMLYQPMIYMEVQRDQSGLTDQDITNGKADKSPYLASYKDHKGKEVHGAFYTQQEFADMRANCQLIETYDSGKKEVVYAACFEAPVKTEKDRQGYEYLKFDSSEIVKPAEMRKTEDVFARQFDVTALAQAIDGSEVKEPFYTSNYNLNSFGEDILANTKPNALVVVGGETSGHWANPGVRTDYGKESIRHAMGTDGRLYPIDYTLMEDREAFDREFDKHDGYIVAAYDGELTVANLAENNPECRDKMWEQLNEVGLSDKVLHGCVLSWFDSVERQRNRNELGLDTRPSVVHENWSEKMEAFRLRCKENAENAGKTIETEKQSQAEKPQEKGTGKSAAGKFHKNQPLIAVWTDQDVVKKSDGSVKGVYLDIQVDQSDLSRKDVQKGAGFSSPSVHYAYSQNPERKANKVFYTARQMDMIQGVGTTTEAGKVHGCSFTANVYNRKTPSGKDTSFVLLPKDEAMAKSNAELDDIRWYNSQNRLQPSKHESFGPGKLKQQFFVTSQVRELMNKGKEAEPVVDTKSKTSEDQYA
ncbi:hypothetical protein AALA61_12990 [Oscillospiraceae bacterium 42-9]